MLDNTLTSPSQTIRRGRKPSLPISQKVAALEAQLAAARQEAKEAEKLRASIVGSVIIAAIQEDAQLKATVVDLLRSKVTVARDKAAIAELLI